MTGTPAAALEVRPADRAGRVRRVLLATDLGPASDLATAWAFDLARAHDAALLVVSVIDQADTPFVDTASVETAGTPPRWDQVRDDRQLAAQRLVDLGRTSGIDARFLVWTGSVAESIIEAAESEAADLIVVGSHGRGRLGRLFWARSRGRLPVARRAPSWSSGPVRRPACPDTRHRPRDQRRSPCATHLRPLPTRKPS